MPQTEKEQTPQAGVLATPPDEYDSPWKEVSGRFFPQLVEYFATDVYERIDWTAGYEFLEQELPLRPLPRSGGEPRHPCRRRARLEAGQV